MKEILLLLFSILQLHALSVQAQDLQKENLADLVQRAERMIQQSDLDSAEILYQFFLSHFKKERDLTRISKCHERLAIIYQSKRDFSKADSLLTAGEELIAPYGDSLDIVRALLYAIHGVVKWNLYDYEKAREYQEISLRLKYDMYKGIHPTIAMNYINIGIIHSSKHDYDSAIYFYEKSYQVMNACNEELLGHKSYVLNNIGVLFLEKGDFTSAGKYFNSCLEYRKKAFGPEHPALVSTLNHLIKIAHKCYNYDNAIELQKFAEHIIVKNFGEYSENHLDFLINKNLENEISTNYKATINELIETESRLNELSVNAYTDNLKFNLQNKISNMYLLVNQYDSAKIRFEKSLQNLVKVEERSLYYYANSVLLNVFSDSSSQEYVVKYLHPMKDSVELDIYHSIVRFIILEVSHHQCPTQFKVEISKEYLSLLKPDIKEFEIISLDQLSNVHELDYFISHKYLIESYLERGLQSSTLDEYINEIITQATHHLQNIPMDKNREAISILLDEISSLSELNYLSQYQRSKKKNLIKKAFQMSDQKKSNSLFTAMLQNNSKQKGGLPDSLFNKENYLLSQISYYKNNLILLKQESKPDIEQISAFQNSYIMYELEYKNYLDSLKELFPDYFSIKEIKTFSIKDIQSKLTKQSCLLQFSIIQDKLFLYLIDSKKIKLYQTDFNKDLENLITAFNNSIIFKIESSEKEFAHLLYSKLFKDINVSTYKTIYISAQNTLYSIPFEALRYRTKKKEEKYLIESSDIVYLFGVKYFMNKSNALPSYTYAYSGVSPSFNTAISNQSSTDSTRSFGRSSFQDYSSIGELAFSSIEVQNIKQLHDKQHLNSQIIQGMDAMEGNVKSVLTSSSKVIHLATHGFVDLQYSDLSFLLMAYDSSQSEDGMLRSSEISDLKINAELIVLSACETGVGKIARSEGVLGLHRSFLYAGAKNSIASLWKVADESTALFMEKFYEKLLENNSISQALGHAKRFLLKHPKYNKPFYWAPFILFEN